MNLRKLSPKKYRLLVSLLVVVAILLVAFIWSFVIRPGGLRNPNQVTNGLPKNPTAPFPQPSMSPEEKKVQDTMISGLQHQQKQEYDQARSAYQEAIKLNPMQIGAYNNIGVTYLNQKQWQAAIEPLQKAISLDSTYMAAHVNLGLAYCHLGNLAAAKAELTTLQKNNVSQADFLTNMVSSGCKAEAS